MTGSPYPVFRSAVIRLALISQCLNTLLNLRVFHFHCDYGVILDGAMSHQQNPAYGAASTHPAAIAVPPERDDLAVGLDHSGGVVIAE